MFVKHRYVEELFGENLHRGVHAEDVGLLLAVALVGVHAEHKRFLIERSRRRRRRCRCRGGGSSSDRDDLCEAAHNGQTGVDVEIVEREDQLVLRLLSHVPDALEGGEKVSKRIKNWRR